MDGERREVISTSLSLIPPRSSPVQFVSESVSRVKEINHLTVGVLCLNLDVLMTIQNG